MRDKKYFWKRIEVEKPDYDLTDKPLLGPWQIFALIMIIVFAAAIFTFILKYYR